MAASDSPTTVKSAGLSVLSFAPPHALFKSKIVVEIIPYYRTTKQFLPLLELIVTRFEFQNMSWNNISFFRF